MPQLSRYLSFLLGKGGNPYISNPMKSYKASKVLFLTNNPHYALSLTSSASATYFKIAQIVQNYMYIFFPWISHLSSNRREWNSAHPFQFMIPGRELTTKPTKIRILSIPTPRKTRISETMQLFTTWDQRIFQNQPRKMFKCRENALIDPRKIATIKESIYFSRTLHHAPTFKTILVALYICNLK